MIPVVLRGGMGAKARTAAPARARAATVADGRHRVLPRGRLRLPALDTLFPAAAISVHTQDAGYLGVIHDEPAEWNPADYAYHLTRRARGLPLWFSLSVHGVSAYSAAIETAIRLARETTAEFRKRGYLELIREPELGVVLFRRRGWAARQYARWADGLLHDQAAFIPPSAGGGETVARFAFLHPHTPMDLVRQILDQMK